MEPSVDKPIYLDHAATTSVDERVLAAMLPYFSVEYGNPSSLYQLGQRARRGIDEARDQIAGILGVARRELIFTSGGTESNNLLIFGVAEVMQPHGRHIILSSIEHDSVLEPVRHLEERGFEVSLLPVGEDGLVEPADLAAALRPDTILVSILYANNEIGTIQPIRELAEVVKKFRADQPPASAGRPPLLPYFHTDACQAAPYLSLKVEELGVDAMTLNGGKIYGPKGVGVLYLREGVKLMPQSWGGGQEYRIRAGTENVPGIVGMGLALELVQAVREEESARLIPLRDRLIEGLLKIPETRLNGHPTRRLPNNVNVSFRGLEGETILMRLDMLNIAASSGSACSSGSLDPSHVIRALGLEHEWSHSSTRFSFGHGSSDEEVSFVLKHLPGVIRELRELSPF
ncbi:cysteine desulfurase NifS [Candidatus Peregrinibacteria bacterium CG_4_9_14_0_2_um_filter_53_11]|nr:MAG: cysteine desulfurase NifS [Candidatus Peregrinibacteria bacterium CG_4_9_14_0_2_um_filter_53_11]